jgi:prepilin-type N-terminal cleavage/methylation domain-containing protein
MPRHSSQLRSAFTLLEMMAVMAIIALVMGWGMLNIQSSKPGYELEREADALAIAMRDLRDKAILSGRAIRLEFTVASADGTSFEGGDLKCYWNEPAPGQTLEDFYEEIDPFKVIALDSDVRIGGVVWLTDEQTESRVVVFSPTGVTTPVRFYLFHVRARDTWCTVRMNPLTGKSQVIAGREEPEEYEFTTLVRQNKNP